MVDWPHAPIHRLAQAGTYFVTGATYLKQRLLLAPDAREYFQELLFAFAVEEECRLQAWAILANHYHLVISAPEGARLKRMLSRLHSKSALGLNRKDGVTGRKVWYQFRDTELTFERSWLTRLRYVHENAVHHGLVRDALEYRWCSAAWFRRTAETAFVKTVATMKIDAVSVYDEF
ncbi:MAG TPA: transposase [Thermoanaerobaculia bacterium]|jgi:putative transposase